MMRQNTIAARVHRAKRTIPIALICFSALVFLLVVSTLPDAVSAGAPNTGNPIRGKDLFEKRCGGCHSLDADKEGPRLRNVYGRKAGSISTFKYSDSLRTARVIWDDGTLDRWLIDTESVVPDNDMDFRVPDADERTDILAYLRVYSGK